MQTCFFYQKLYDICNSRIIEKVTLTYLTFLILFTQGYLNILIFSREIDIYVFYINTLKIFIYDIFKKWMNFILVWLSVSIYRMKRVIVYLVLHIAELINMYSLWSHLGLSSWLFFLWHGAKWYIYLLSKITL